MHIHSSKRYIATLVMLLFVMVASAQNFTTRGKTFWMGFMENIFSTGDLSVYITSDVATSGTVSIPLQGWTQNFTVTPGVSTQIAIPYTQGITLGSGAITNTGIRIVAQDTVTVFALNYQPNTADATVILPIQTIGNQYYVMAYRDNQSPYSDKTEFLIAGCYNNTLIEITPSVNTTSGQNAGTPFQITINAGETYQIQSTDDLTGTLVRSIPNGGNCPNFALYGGNVCTGVQCAYCDHLYEQLYPAYTWGQQYVVPPLKTRADDRYRILAQDAGTIVNINGGANINLNAGQFHEFDTGTASFISANKPVSVAQFSKGSDCDNTDSDPFTIMLSPTNQQLTNITFNAFTSSIITAYYLNVVTRTANTNVVTLDGNNIGAQFSAVPSNNAWSFAQLTITQGDHTLQSDSGFVAYVYGYGNDESYGYPVGANLTNLFARFNYIPADSTLDTAYICPNTLIKFRGIGDSTVSTYEWDFGDGNFGLGRTVFHSYANFGIYDVKMIISRPNACGKDTLSSPVRVLGPTPNLVEADTICQGASLTLNAAPTTGTYTWNTGATTQSITVSPNTTTVYWVYLEDSLCRGQPDSVTVYVSNPTADFTFVEQCLGDSVSFINNSTSGLDTISNYNWQFGDGQNSTLLNPTHLYSTFGNFNVSLTVTSALGCTNTKTLPLVNHALPLAAFSFNNVCEGIATVLTDNSSVATDLINAWNWNFDDGNTSTQQSPQHTFADTGIYSIELIASSSFGCKDTVNNNVEVFFNPIADFTFSNECLGTNIDFVNTSSTGNGIVYNWNFDDGDTSTQQSPNHLYNQDSTYNVLLTVTTNNNCFDTITKAVTVYPVPNADFAFNNVCNGVSTIFNNTTTINSGSFNSSWNFDDGNFDSSLNPQHLYTDSGTYNVQLIVNSNNNCADTITKVVEVYLQPVANFTFNQVCFGLPTSFIDNSLPASGLNYNWNFDDGSTTNTQSSPSYTYANAGTYDVQLKVTTANNCSDSIAQSVEVYAQPQPAFSANNACLNDVTNFQDQSFIINGNIQNWNWDIGNGVTSSNQNDSYTYGSIGNYTVQLKVASNNGCEDSLSKTIEVFPLPSATSSSTTACYNENNVTATVYPADGTPPYTVSWSSSENTETISQIFAGDYEVTVTDANNCTVVITETVVQQPFPVILETNIAIDTIRFGDTISVVSVSGNYDPYLTYIWTPNNGLGCDTCLSTFATPLQSVIYTITGTDTIGCTGSTSIEVIVINDYIIYIPNAFTPDNDGTNDEFKVYSKGVKNYTLQIFNRWGERIFETNNLAQGWDGTYLNKQMMPEVYIYVTQLEFLDGYTTMKKGSVTLIR